MKPSERIELSRPSERIELAKISSRQAVVLAVITAVVGLVTGYLSKASPGMNDPKIAALEAQVRSFDTTLTNSSRAELEAQNEIAALKQSRANDATQASTKILELETQIRNIEKAQLDSNKIASQALNDLNSLKQRVRDILGPKDDKIRQMSVSLERLKGDPGVSRDHRDRLSEIVQELDKIDTKVLEIVQR